MELRTIPPDLYADYRYKVIFAGYKWDPQVGDTSTISRHAIVLDAETAQRLAQWAEDLAGETVHLEGELLGNTSLYRQLGIGGELKEALNEASTYQRDKHVRLMRFDFHPTLSDIGWAVSEVNSDVPGGLAEADVLPRLASEYLPGTQAFGDMAGSLIESFGRHLKLGDTVGFVHATAYTDDRQVMEYTASRFRSEGYNCAFISPDHVVWQDNRAYSIAEGQDGPLGSLIRFFPAEWLCDLPRRTKWKGFFSTTTASCNHPVAILAQSKRLPLVWDRLTTSGPTWRSLLPETISPPRLKSFPDSDWVLKPAWGRVGELISIKEATPAAELAKIKWNARLFPSEWVLQKRFTSRPLSSTEGELHICIGVFTVQGKAAGFYGRASSYPRIDSNAIDIPVLVASQTCEGGLV